jgi:hypothetical protein
MYGAVNPTTLIWPHPVALAGSNPANPVIPWPARWRSTVAAPSHTHRVVTLPPVTNITDTAHLVTLPPASGNVTIS